MELTDPSNSGGWFDQACKSGVQCDLLIISGHFGGKFFGSSGLSLSLEQLEKNSCSGDCQGILKNPKEVFLFGCNTLAEKEKDHRTPEEYARVLMQDGFDRATAERIVEGRYGETGASNRTRMKMAFAGVPHLYGFNSVGPKGKNIKGFLDRYLRDKKDYAGHLLKDATQELSRDLNRANQQKFSRVKQNQELAQALKNTSFFQCSGLNSNGEEYELKQTICAIQDSKRSVEDRLAIIHEVMKSDRFLAYLPAIQQFLRDHTRAQYSPREKALLQKIQNETKAKEKILALLAKARVSTVYEDLNNFSLRLGWITQTEYQKNIKSLALRLLIPPVSIESKDWICSLSDEYLELLQKTQYQEFHPDLFKSSVGISALICITPQDPAIHKALAETLKDANAEVREAAAFVLREIKPQDPIIHKALVEALKDADGGVREAAARALNWIKPQDPVIHNALAETLKDANAEVREEAASALREIRPTSLEYIETLRALTSDPNPDVKKAAEELLRIARQSN